MGFSLGSVINPIVHATGLGGIVDKISGGLRRPDAPSLPGAPTLKAPTITSSDLNAPTLTGVQLPQYPGLSPEEQQLLQQRTQNANQFGGMVGQQGQQNQQTQQAFQGLSGLYGADGQINPQAVQQIQQQIAQFQQQQQALNTQGVNQLQGMAGQGANPYAGNNPNDTTNNQIYSAEQQRYLNALSGNNPVSQGLQQQKAADWEKTKQQAALLGIKLSGNSPESAASQSTAGNQLITDFNKRYGYLQDQERLGAISQGGGQNLARMGLNANIQNQQYNQAQGLRGNLSDVYGPQMGFAQTAAQYGPQATAGLYGQADQLFSGIQNPYAQQRLGQFGVNTNQALSDADIANQNIISRTAIGNQNITGRNDVSNQNVLAGNDIYNQNQLNTYNAAVGQTMANYNNALAGYQGNMGLLSGALGLGGQLGSAFITRGASAVPRAA